jgi:RNA polymerase sporulation-specific sigma factor
MFGLLFATRTYSADKKASFKTYASVCIRNKMASVIRAASRGNKGGDVPYYVQDAVDFRSNPEEMVIAGETRKSVSDFIASELSEFEQNVIRLYLAGSSYKEISDRLSSHPKAVDNALQRIRRKLKSFA